MRVLDMPNELLLEVAEYLPIKDLSMFRSTSRRLSIILTTRFESLCLKDVYTDSCKLTALQWAAIRGHTSLIELAVSKGAGIDEPMRGKLHVNSRALCRASRPKFKRMCHMANNGTKSKAQDSQLRTPLFLAACAGHVQAIETLLGLGASMKCTAGMDTGAHVSARQADAGCVRVLVAAGFDLGARGRLGQTILHDAAHSQGEVIRIVLQHKGGEVLVNARDRFGSTPLHTAVSHNNVRAVQLLLQHGADIHARDKKGDTPAHYAVQEGLSRMDCWNVLVAAGIDFQARGYGGQTILHEAVQTDVKTVKYLLKTEGVRKIINAQDDDGMTALGVTEFCAAWNQERLVELLLKHGAVYCPECSKDSSIPCRLAGGCGRWQ